MEKFTTLIDDNYNLEQQMKSLLKEFVSNESDIKLIECNKSEVKVSFKPKFETDTKNVFHVLKEISKVAGEYKILENIKTDKKEFSLTLKRVYENEYEEGEPEIEIVDSYDPVIKLKYVVMVKGKKIEIQTIFENNVLDIQIKDTVGVLGHGEGEEFGGLNLTDDEIDRVKELIWEDFEKLASKIMS